MNFEQWKRYIASEAEEITEDECQQKFNKMIDIFEYKQRRKVINKKILLHSRPPSVTQEIRENYLREQVQRPDRVSLEQFDLLIVALHEIKKENLTEFAEIIEAILNLSE